MKEKSLKRLLKALCPLTHEMIIAELAYRTYPPRNVVNSAQVSFVINRYADGHITISNVGISAVSVTEYSIICSALKDAEQKLNSTHEKIY